MLTMNLSTAQRILCLGAHADDIEIGCGGSLLSLLGAKSKMDVRWIVFSGSDLRGKEAAASAERFLAAATSKDISVERFRDGFFPYDGDKIKKYFEELKSEARPDVIFTHYRHDLHQDHRLISELTWNTFRDHLILEYEVPKYDGGMGSPNLFLPMGMAIVEQKLRLIRECFPSQREKRWFEAETFQSLMRLRGVECNASTKYAEAFYARKICLQGN